LGYSFGLLLISKTNKNLERIIDYVEGEQEEGGITKMCQINSFFLQNFFI
jgi:hypothetical protein